MDDGPNWRKWKAVPRVTLREGIALSLNVEPGQLKESKEFGDRLFVAIRNLHGALKAKAAIVDDPAECLVSLSEFAAWAISVEWKIPDEFTSLTEAQRWPTPRDNKREVQELRSRERETLLKLIFGMARGGYGYDPKAERSKVVTEIVDDLAKLSISIDGDTVRKWLRVAATEVDWHRPSDQR
jgi:hypothetical protein